VSNPFDDAEYLPIPELSPYTKHDRYERPKEIFKHLAAKLERVTQRGRAHDYADIATANGELLYHLRRRFPHWTFKGYDLTPEFIAAGRSFPGLEGVELSVGDLYDVHERFDIVSFINVMTTFWDPEEPLAHLLSLVREGGILLVDGCFNEYDVELRAVFMDNSRPESAGKWRRECSQHSRTSIARFLEGRCRRFEFEEVPMGVEIPRLPDAPHSNVWTFKDEGGRNHITNGTHLLMDRSLLTVYR
jgi:SAM-dependent methyltransferase